MLNKETFLKQKDLIKTCNFEQDFRFLHGCVIVMPLFSETEGGELVAFGIGLSYSGIN